MGTFTETKTVKIVHNCGLDNPIYLCWLNAVGGFSYWLFDKYSKSTTQTKTEGSYNKNISNLETAIGNADILGKNITPKIDVGSVVKLEDMDGLRGLFESPKVFMLANPLTWETDGIKWKTVIVQASSLVILETKVAFYEMKLTLILPDRNVQSE